MNKNIREKYHRIPLLGVAALIALVFIAQFIMSFSRQSADGDMALQIAQRKMIAFEGEDSKNWESYDSFNQAKADMIAMLIDSIGDSALSQSSIVEFQKKWDLKGLYIVRSGSVTSAGKLELTQHTIDKFNKGSSFDSDKDAKVCFYSTKLKNGARLIVACDCSDMLSNEDYLSSPEAALKNISFAKGGCVAAFEKQADGYKAAYTPKKLDASKLSSIAATDRFKDGKGSWLSAGGKLYYASCCDAEDYRLLALLPLGSVLGHTARQLALAVILFAAVFELICLYMRYLAEDVRLKREKSSRLKDKIRTALGVGLISIFVVSSYFCMISSVSECEKGLSRRMDSIQTALQENSEHAEEINETCEKDYLKRAQRIAYMFKKCPELIDNDRIADLAKASGITTIAVFDTKGRTVATNSIYDDFTLSKNEDDQSYPFWSVAKGYTDYYIQDPVAQETGQSKVMQYIGVKRLDARGMVQIGLAPDRLGEHLYGEEIGDIVQYISTVDGGTVTATKASDIETEKLSFEKRKGSSCLVFSRTVQDNDINISVPIASFMLDSIILALIITVISAFVLVILVRRLESDDELKDELLTPVEGAEDDDNEDDSVFGAEEFDYIAAPWKNLNAQRKMGRIFFVGIAVLVILLVCVQKLVNLGEHSVLDFIMSMQWNRSFNLFSLTYMVFMAAEVLFITSIARYLIHMFTAGGGSRPETVGRLINSIIKYSVAIGLVFYCLYLLGFDTKTLLASAGIITLGISLGAQSLVSDIIAGLFIVFEGDLRVGDIVMINDFRGQVKEIGIRTTKIENTGGDIKIYRNSDVSGVINMTKQYSFAIVDCGIEYSESIERVESILKRELPPLKDKLPEIVTGPFYKGVVELGDSSVVIRVMAQCSERDRIKLTRDLNRQIKLIFDKYDVGIPFPQIVVNQPAERIKATELERREAEEFINEQKLASDYYDESDE